MTRGSSRPSEGEHYRAAIARWQLGLQTELKRASSLPSAMFDACDPMLEARLAEATESLFRALLELEPQAGRPATDAQQLEVVRPDELAALLAAAAGGQFAAAAPPPIDEDDDAEFFAILAETCGRGDGPWQQRASALLGATAADDLDGRSDLDDLDALTAAIAARVAGDAPLPSAATAALATACRRAATAVWQEVRRADTEGRP